MRTACTRRFMRTLRVRLTPKAGSDQIDGVSVNERGEEVLCVRVRAAPEKGKANAALEQVVARELGVGRASVQLARGATSRLKVLHVDVSDDVVDALLSRWKHVERPC